MIRYGLFESAQECEVMKHSQSPDSDFFFVFQRHVINPDRDELRDMEAFLTKVIQKVKVPFMIDSTDEKVVELALKYSQGKSIINSINLEDGEERFGVVPQRATDHAHHYTG